MGSGKLANSYSSTDDNQAQHVRHMKLPWLYLAGQKVAGASAPSQFRDTITLETLNGV